VKAEVEDVAYRATLRARERFRELDRRLADQQRRSGRHSTP
jgi:hypothetical protein